MSVFTDRIKATMDRIRDLTGSPTFKWKGADIPCVVNTFAKGTILEIGGFQIQCDGKLFVKKSDFLTMDSTAVTIDTELVTMDDDRPTPVAGRTLKLNGKAVRITRTEDPIPTDADGTWVLFYKDVTQ